jgi:TonB-linked SusC/RagA family outer membrane protein
MSLGRWRILAASGAALMLLLPAARSLQAQGTIRGRITASSGGQPLAGARVLVLGGNQTAVSSEDGRYTLRNVGVGTIQLQALRVGYQSLKKVVTVAGAADSVSADFALTEAVVQLQEVVTTATGEQRRVELGNAVATLGDVSKLAEERKISTLGELLQSKTPGVIVLPATTLGGPPTFRIRGVSSISLSNAPIIYVDGVRFSSNTLTSGTDTPFSLLNTLNPDEIEDIEIVKGPSAATLYGTNAANGVVLITTKRGRAGTARWAWTAEQGRVEDRSPYPDMYAAWGHRADGSPGQIRCQLATMNTSTYTNLDLSPSQQCITDSLTHYNYLRDPDNTFIGNGQRSLYGMQVNGGSEALRYFASAETEDETGIVKMPWYEIRRFDSLKVGTLPEWRRPLAQKRQSFRGNLSAALSPKVDLNINTGFSRLYNRQPPGDDLIIALLYVGIQNYGFKGPGLDKITTQSGGTPLHDAYTFAPGDIMQNINESTVQRTTASANMAWRPFTWMQNDGTVGVDLSVTNYFQICKVNECPPANATARAGRVTDNKVNRRNISGKLSSTSTWDVRPWANLKTSVGGDYTAVEDDFVNSNGVTLPPGATTVAAASTRNASQKQPTAVKTLGAYGQEQLGLRDRMFLTVALRTDQNSAFGTNFQEVYYPKVSLSWLLSDETVNTRWNWLNKLYFPTSPFVNSFRLRLAYGASGVQPGATDGLAIFNPAAVAIASRTTTTGTDTPGLTENQPANANLKPERSAEFEGGFEMQMLNSKVHFDYTYYNKKTKDALIAVNFAPSSAAAQLNPLQNIGSTQNWGHEAQVTAQVLDTRYVGWDVLLSASHNSNKVVDLGIDPNTNKPRFLRTGSGGTSGEVRQVPGYPISGQWFRDYTYNDDNGDGVLQIAEVHVDSGFTFIGYRVPRDLISIQNGIDLFQRKLRINAMFDYKGGNSTQDGANNFQCTTNPFACRETQDPTAPLDLQARAIAKFYGSVVGTAGTFKSGRGYFRSNQFWKFRELSAAYTLPDRVLSPIRARSGSTLVFAARNLHTWSSWTGIDPEANYGLTQTEGQNEFQTFGAPTYYTFRLNLKY